ncbi:glycerate kinase [Calothrix rhizosoleniae]|uniref:glycerate kinase n=1 Tax=Calothrix rhizosoleniae TaxID=888997 RepID=UPI00190EF612|nr:glycerate kinase [Calothrix rhizosoleniae]
MNAWLQDIFTITELNPTWQQQAIDATLTDKLRTKAFAITPENVEEVIENRFHLFKSIYPAFSQFCQTNLQIRPAKMLGILWDYWLPLGIKIASQRQQLGHPFIQGILGGQGTGKTTMCGVMKIILSQLGYTCLSLSLDDLYKTYSDRLILQQQDPRLIWRGPPGTHDVDLGLHVLQQIHQGNSPIVVPRFDKSLHQGAGDRTTSKIVHNIDIVLFEGWFVGVEPINQVVFDHPPPPIMTTEDKKFARDMNLKLHDYLPLWNQLDSLIMLHPQDYRLSLTWRKQAEHQMIATGKPGMSDTQIENFVNFFWRTLHPELFIPPLLETPTIVDLVIEINCDHLWNKIYQPGLCASNK